MAEEELEGYDETAPPLGMGGREEVRRRCQGRREGGNAAHTLTHSMSAMFAASRRFRKLAGRNSKLVRASTVSTNPRTSLRLTETV